MKKLKYLLGIGLLSSGLISCDLDSESLTEKNSETFPKNATDVSEGLTAVYANLPFATNPQHRGWMLYTMLAGDEMLGGGGPNDQYFQAYDYIQGFGVDESQAYFVNRYSGVARANVLINNINSGTATLSEDEKAQYLGEAKFLRAYYYYELASMYGAKIPLVLTSDGSDDHVSNCKEMWGQILQDLYDAATTMPKTQKTDGHVDRYTAQAMLGRAFLFYTGMYGTSQSDDISNLTSTSYDPAQSVTLAGGKSLTIADVAKLIDECVDESGYYLVKDYRNLWAYTNKYTKDDYKWLQDQTPKDGQWKWAEDDGAANPESMFAIKFNQMETSELYGFHNGMALYFGIRGGQDMTKTFPFGQGWGAGPVSGPLYTEWNTEEPGDIRRDATICDVYKEMSDGKGGTLYKFGQWGFRQETPYYSKKFAPIGAYNGETVINNFDQLMYGNSGPNSANFMQLGNIHDMVLIRFAEVLLMQSELNESVDGINEVRERAGLGTIGAYSLEALQMERKHELACEGVRFNDIRRWHIAASALDKQLDQDVHSDDNGPASNDLSTVVKNSAHGVKYSTRYNQTAGFYKIPETQVTLSKINLKQNAGWETDDQYGSF